MTLFSFCLQVIHAFGLLPNVALFYSNRQENSNSADFSECFNFIVLVKPSKPAPKQVLKKLLNRIRSQRNDWSEPSHASAAEPVAVLTDEIPERDTSIDTGSLASVEKNKRFPSVPGKSELFAFIQLFEPKTSVPIFLNFFVYCFRWSENKKGLWFC